MKRRDIEILRRCYEWINSTADVVFAHVDKGNPHEGLLRTTAELLKVMADNYEKDHGHD